MLSMATKAEIASWSAPEKTTVDEMYRQSHPDGSGVAWEVAFGATQEVRVLDILMARFPAQLAATPLIKPQYQEMADRLAVNLNDPSVSLWTSETPPAVEVFTMGDVDDFIGAANFPQVIVSGSLPLGNDLTYETLGLSVDNRPGVFCYYVLPFEAGIKRQLEAMRGAEAMANLLVTYATDPVTCWQDGKVQVIQRNIPLSKKATSPMFAAGIVAFTAFTRSFTRQA